MEMLRGVRRPCSGVPPSLRPGVSGEKTLPFSCPLLTPRSGNSPQHPANVFRETSQYLSALRLRPATPGNLTQRAANDLKIHC